MRICALLVLALGLLAASANGGFFDDSFLGDFSDRAFESRLFPGGNRLLPGGNSTPSGFYSSSSSSFSSYTSHNGKAEVSAESKKVEKESHDGKTKVVAEHHYTGSDGKVHNHVVTKEIPRDGSKGREKNKEDVKSVKREQSDNTVDSNAFPTLEDKTWVTEANESPLLKGFGLFSQRQGENKVHSQHRRKETAFPSSFFGLPDMSSLIV